MKNIVIGGCGFLVNRNLITCVHVVPCHTILILVLAVIVSFNNGRQFDLVTDDIGDSPILSWS